MSVSVREERLLLLHVNKPCLYMANGVVFVYIFCVSYFFPHDFDMLVYCLFACLFFVFFNMFNQNPIISKLLGSLPILTGENMNYLVLSLLIIK